LRGGRLAKATTPADATAECRKTTLAHHELICAAQTERDGGRGAQGRRHQHAIFMLCRDARTDAVSADNRSDMSCPQDPGIRDHRPLIPPATHHVLKRRGFRSEIFLKFAFRASPARVEIDRSWRG